MGDPYRSWQRAVRVQERLMARLGVGDWPGYYSLIERRSGARPGYDVTVTRDADGETLTGRVADTQERAV